MEELFITRHIVDKLRLSGEIIYIPSPGERVPSGNTGWVWCGVHQSFGISLLQCRNRNTSARIPHQSPLGAATASPREKPRRSRATAIKQLPYKLKLEGQFFAMHRRWSTFRNRSPHVRRSTPVSATMGIWAST